MSSTHTELIWRHFIESELSLRSFYVYRFMRSGRVGFGRVGFGRVCGCMYPLTLPTRDAACIRSYKSNMETPFITMNAGNICKAYSQSILSLCQCSPSNQSRLSLTDYLTGDSPCGYIASQVSCGYHRRLEPELGPDHLT